MNKIKKITCAILGHSNILRFFFGYNHCARCGQLVGDSLAGVYSNPKAVIVNHGCETCKENYKRLSWKDKFLAPGKKKIFP